MSNLNISVVRGKDGLFSIRDDWLQLTASLANKRFFHLYQWYESYIETIEDDHLSVYFLIVYENDMPVSIFPLKKVTRKILGLNFHVLEIPDHPHIDLSDFVYRNSEVVRGSMSFLVHYLEKNSPFVWDYISLPHVLEDSPTLPSLMILHRNHVVREFIGACDYIPSYEEMNNRLSRNFRSNLRKARNKLLRLNNVEFVSVRKGEELHRAFEQFLDVEAFGWKGQSGANTAIKLHPQLTEFYKSLLKSYSEIDSCEINLLKMGDECLAAQFCLPVGDTNYILKIGYNEEYGQLAPGNILLENVIRRSAENDGVNYINLITGSNWHANWKPESYKIVRARIFNRTPAGSIAFMLTKAKHLLRPVYQHYVRWQLHIESKEAKKRSVK